MALQAKTPERYSVYLDLPSATLFLDDVEEIAQAVTRQVGPVEISTEHHTAEEVTDLADASRSELRTISLSAQTKTGVSELYVSISLRQRASSMRASGPYRPAVDALCDAVTRILRRHRGFGQRLTFWVIALLSAGPIDTIAFAHTGPFGLLACAIGLAWLIMMGEIFIFGRKGRVAVRPMWRKDAGFWARHRETIVIGILVSIPGLAVNVAAVVISLRK